MKKIVFIGSHLGYAMEKTPLGGGAMVGLQLLRHWPIGKDWDITALGSGPVAPQSGVEYVQMAGREEGLVDLSEFQYARFCRSFEKATTGWLLAQRDRFDPKDTCVIVNDISEGPSLAKLSAAGYPIVSLWHVDVVDYFNKLYLRNFIAPERLTRLYERSRRLGMTFAIPDVLRLVFEKQRETVAHSSRMIFPSRMMAQTVERCYAKLLKKPETFKGRSSVIPWGIWDDGIAEEEIAQGAASLRTHYQLKDDSLVLMTLSRISPEKGLHLLLRAMRFLEAQPGFKAKDIVLFLCGEPAFMQGASYAKLVHQEARRLKRARVFFPGYLAAADKRKYLRLARLFISPSIHESYGLNIVEAMRAGLPVLASDHYGVHDVLTPRSGRVVHYPSPARAPEALAAALKDLLGKPALLAAMGRAARQAALAMPFSAAADKILEAAREALAP